MCLQQRKFATQWHKILPKWLNFAKSDHTVRNAPQSICLVIVSDQSMSVHGSGPDFLTCDVCQMTFHNLASLKRHETSHFNKKSTTSRPLDCSLCHQKFKSSTSLKVTPLIPVSFGSFKVIFRNKIKDIKGL